MTLKLIANDSDDLKIVASALQDAILRVDDIDYNVDDRSVTLRMSRFRHEARKAERVETGLRIDGVTAIQSQGIDRTNPDAFLVLLDASLSEDDAPAGLLTLTFAGGGALRLQIEALDMILADVSEGRRTRHRPDHALS